MLADLLKRLSILIATLFGILVLVFALIRIAPGEPDPSILGEGAEQGKLSTESSYDSLLRYRIRRHLDLPLLLDTAPLDRDAHAAYHLERALPSASAHFDERERGLSRAALRLQGAAAVPVLLRALEESSRELSGDDRSLVEERLEELGWDGEKRPGRWDEERMQAEMERVVRSLAHPDGEVDPALLARADRLGSLLFPRLVERLEERDAGGAARARLLGFIELHREVHALDRTLAQASASAARDPEQRLEEVLRWWDEEGLRYRRLGGLERAAALLLHTQFATWILSAARFDFGRDLSGRRIGEQLLRRLEVTLPLMGVALILIFSIAIPLGVWLATTRRRLGASTLTATLYALYSAPQFWIALVLLAIFAAPGPIPIFAPSWSTYELPAGAGPLEALVLALRRCVLPVLALSLPALAYLVRQTRASMVEVLEEDYIRTARAKGLRRRRVVWRHAWRNSLLPILTLLGGTLPALVGGSLIVESVFEIPGMGRYAYEALERRDYNVIMAVTTLSGVLTLVGLQLSELAYRWADPRIADGRH